MTDEGPSLDSFLRHLQTEVEAAMKLQTNLSETIRLVAT